MLDWVRIKKRLTEIDKSLEEQVTQGRLSFIISINYDLINKSLDLSSANSPEYPIIDRVLWFEKVEGLLEQI